MQRGKLTEHTIDSEQMGYTARKLTIYTPFGYDANKKYPLVVMLADIVGFGEGAGEADELHSFWAAFGLRREGVVKDVARSTELGLEIACLCGDDQAEEWVN